MRVLLDTHVLLWMAGQPDKLSERAIEYILDERNSLFLSLVSIWEIQIKSQLGKLKLSETLPTLVNRQRTVNGVQILPIVSEHIYSLQALPYHHRDPFDRLLIAQSLFEEMSVISIDGLFDAYPINKVW